MSRGKTENASLQKNLEEQLDRLVEQLSDLEENRDCLEDSEYAEMKEETINQLKEFSETLSKFKQGELSLVDDINRMQLAIQASISNAFQTPDIIKYFAKKQPGQLRNRLAEVERDMKVGKLSQQAGQSVKAEILSALARLGENLLPEEHAFMEANARTATKEFAKANDSIESNKVMASFTAAGST